MLIFLNLLLQIGKMFRRAALVVHVHVAVRLACPDIKLHPRAVVIPPQCCCMAWYLRPSGLEEEESEMRRSGAERLDPRQHKAVSVVVLASPATTLSPASR